MTRYMVEYRRLCPFTKEMRDWKNYYTSEDKMSAMEMYCQHLTHHSDEECRLISFNDEPNFHHLFIPPTDKNSDDSEEEAA